MNEGGCKLLSFHRDRAHKAAWYVGALYKDVGALADTYTNTTLHYTCTTFSPVMFNFNKDVYFRRLISPTSVRIVWKTLGIPSLLIFTGGIHDS